MKKAHKGGYVANYTVDERCNNRGNITNRRKIFVVLEEEISFVVGTLVDKNKKMIHNHPKSNGTTKFPNENGNFIGSVLLFDEEFYVFDNIATKTV